MTAMAVMPDSIRTLWATLAEQRDPGVPEGFTYHEEADAHGVPIGYQAFTPQSDEALPLVVYMAGTHHANNETNDKQLHNPACHVLTHPDFPYRCHIIAPWNPTEGHPPNTEEGRGQTLTFADGVSRIIARYTQAHQPVRTDIFEADESDLAKLQEISDRENLPAWSYLR